MFSRENMTRWSCFYERQRALKVKNWKRVWIESHAPLPRLSDAYALSTTSRAPLTPAVVRTPQIAEDTLLCSYKKLTISENLRSGACFNGT